MNIKIIVGSVRQGRIGPQIAQWAHNNIPKSGSQNTTEVIDLSSWHLPMDDEPHLPATGEYLQPHTKLWSDKISEGDMFIFVFPQYNWGYPAALKNAIDHLYKEWKDKPALIITYANRGGGKAAAQLRQVLEGIHMHPLDASVEIKLSELAFDPQGKIKDCEKCLEKYNDLLLKSLDEAFVFLEKGFEGHPCRKPR